MGIKSYVKEWMSEKWDQWVKRPIADKTVQLESQVQQTVSPHISKAKETAYKPVDYYHNQDAFYRGVFWIAVGCLVVLWMISGS